MIRLPIDVANIIQILADAGFEAYAVGGCVRDSLLGREPNDWDITTNALPQQVKGLFNHTIDTGLAHGTVTVMMNKVGYEITTYRMDGEYEDARHPKEVTFTLSLEEDLKRRDFTINAMAYNEKRGLVDLFGGVNDLENKVICAVGDATERFTEDALRMMRAVRFSAQLGYEIEEKTFAAIQKLSGNLRKISAERIQVELVKLLTSNHPEKMEVLYSAGITKVIMPQFDRLMETEQNNPHHCYNVGMHTVHAIEEMKPDKVLRLAMLFHDMGKPDTKTTDEAGIDHFHGHAQNSEEYAHRILKELKFDNDTLHKVKKLTLYHDYKITVTSKGVRKIMSILGEEMFLDLLEIKRADTLAQSNYHRDEKLDELKKIKEIYFEIKEKDECISLKDLAVTGQDLIAAGIKPGPEMGKVLQYLLDCVIEEPEKNTKEKLLDIVNNVIK